MSSGRRHGGVGGREMICALYHWTKSSKEMRWSLNRNAKVAGGAIDYVWKRVTIFFPRTHATTAPPIAFNRRTSFQLDSQSFLSATPSLSWAELDQCSTFSSSLVVRRIKKRGLGRHCHRILFKFFFFSQVLFEKGKIKKAFQTADKLSGERNLGRRILGIGQNKIFPRNESAISNLY